MTGLRAKLATSQSALFSCVFSLIIVISVSYSLFLLGLSQIWCRSSCLQYHEQGKYRLSVSFYLSIKCIDFDHIFFLHSNYTSYCFQEFMGDEQGHVKGIKTVQIKWVQVRFILNQTLKLTRRCLETGAQGACKHAPHLLLTASQTLVFETRMKLYVLCLRCSF